MNRAENKSVKHTKQPERSKQQKPEPQKREAHKIQTEKFKPDDATVSSLQDLQRLKVEKFKGG